MKYALNLAENNRVLSVTYYQYASKDSALTDFLPDGNVCDYLFVDGNFIYAPEHKEEIIETPSQLDIIEAQVAYTAMMTNTLLEV